MEARKNEKNARSLKRLRKDLRSNGTPAEAKLWTLLKNKQVENLRFRRQFSIGNYILDFYCPELKLSIELDGDYHYNSQKHEIDKDRDSILYKELGIKTLRFENHIVFDTPNIIIYSIIREKMKNSVQYPFDELIERRGTNCYKWDDAPEGVIPMWIADMDFQTAPFIIEALKKRVEHGVFGYTKVPDSYYEAVVNWFKYRHGWQNLQKEWILYTSGVVPALSVVIKAFTQPGDQVIVQTPVYNCFFSSIRNNGCEIVRNALIYENQTYHMDFEDLERKASDPKAKLLLLCNPHNPAGRVWTRDELQKLGEICIRHDVLVVSDEIHCEFVFPGHKFVPFASISEALQHHSITCNAPSKAFNTAGLQIANIISDNPEYRQKIDRAININEVCDVNPFGVVALQSAYTDDGAEWLRQLNEYLLGNYNYLKEYFEKEIPQFPITKLEGTYLAWVDCSVVLDKRKDGPSLSHCGLDAPLPSIEEYLLKRHQVQVNDGSMYGDERFIRINLACPRKRLEEGLKRIVSGLKDLL